MKFFAVYSVVLALSLASSGLAAPFPKPPHQNPMNPAPPAGGGSHVGQSGRPMSPSPPAGGGSHVGQSV
ncbi:hypothetical protein FRC20_009439, partial [Serendipita sp. 405]